MFVRLELGSREKALILNARFVDRQENARATSLTALL